MAIYREVELIPAHEWACDDCGRKNYVSCVTAELTPNERKELAKEYKGFVSGGEYLTLPEEVQCEHCGAAFKVKQYNTDANED